MKDSIEKTYSYIPTPNGTKIVFYTNSQDHQHNGYLFLATDYQNSIWAIMDQSGQIVEEMAYDPWGNRRDVATGNPLYMPGQNGIQTHSGILFRGYTLHEHLEVFGLINMNGRLYDPQLARMLSPDNFVQNPENTQNFNRYSYVLNNPLKYTDPSGEFIFTAAALIAAPFTGGASLAYLPMAMSTDIGWISGGINASNRGSSFMSGAIQGGMIGAMNGVLSMVSPLKVPFGNSPFGLSIAPQIAVGSDGMGIGANATVGYDFAKGFTAGVNIGATYYSSAIGTGESNFEGRIGYGIGYKGDHFQAGIASNYFLSGKTAQQTGQLFVGGGKWKVTYENDTWAPVPGLIIPGGAESDRFRTAALRLDITRGGLKGANAGLNIFTGESNGRVGPNGNYIEPGNRYRMGALYLGYGNYRIGYNSEKNIRGPIQNGFHSSNIPFLGLPIPPFEVLNISDRFYGGFYSSNPYTLW